ncbi:myb-like protein X [Mytilus californianus]|uniref:myb-like protein X n=1 Tax=Mytilus californianus TaxID=6549 RepID=UPI0022450945|nr:myb-like protein X [Mytilus californianus]
MVWIFVICVIFTRIAVIEPACSNTLPFPASSTWRTSSRGTWTISADQLQINNFEVTTSSTAGPFKTTMNCEDDTTDTDGYTLLKSSATYTLFGGAKYIYLCVKFEQKDASSTDSYLYYFGSGLTFDVQGSTQLSVGVYERIILLPTASTFTFATLCADKSTAAERTHVAIKDGTEDNAAITCPTSIHGTFSYSDTTCTSTFLDVCSTLTQFYFNYTVCADEQIFSAGGQLLCVYSSTSSNNNYLTLYNKDASPDGTTNYQYACLVYSTSGTIVSASINPKECFDSTLQTPTSTAHPDGVTRTFTNYGDSVCSSLVFIKHHLLMIYVIDQYYVLHSDPSSTTSTNLLWLYILIAIIIILIIIAIIILICYLKRKKKRKEQKKADEESLHPSESEEEEKRHDEEQKREEQKRESSPIPVKDEDRTSIDSGIQQDKKDEEKTKKVVIEDIKDDKEEEQQKSDENSNEMSQQNENLTDEAINDKENQNNSIINHNTDDKEKINNEAISQSENEYINNENVENSVGKNDNDMGEDQQIDQKIINNDQNEQMEQSKEIENDNETEIKITPKDNTIDESIISSQNNNNDLNDKEDDTKDNNEQKDEVHEDQNPQNDTKNETEDENPDQKVVEKQNRSVRIYERVDLDDNLDQRKTDDVTGVKNTEQNTQTIKVKAREEEVITIAFAETLFMKISAEIICRNYQKKDVEDEAESSGSEETPPSSRVTTPDPEEIERNIRKIGMKKSTDFKPQGELSKVLVSRKMEEQKRKDKDHGKWTKMKNMFRVKSKKIKVANQQNNDKKEDGRRSPYDSDDERLHREKTIAPFMKEYQYKKQMDHVLDEQHVREGESDYRERIKYSDDEDFADIFDDDKKLKEQEKIEQTRIEQLNEKNKHEGKKPLQSSKNAGEKGHTKGSDKMGKKQMNGKEIDELERAKRKQINEDQGKDSGVDSPDFRKENTATSFIENNEEMEAVEMTEPPPGYIRDSTGQIIRLYDGKVMTQEEMQSIFPTARLGVLFHVPRLKRTSHGRPTGEYIEDSFGPKLENDKESIRNVELKEEHSKPKHPRSSKGSARRDLKEKTVAFEMDDRQSMNSDILMVEDEDEWKKRRDSSTTNRELLRKRLFKNKRKTRSHGGADNRMFMSDDGRPRELSELVRVIPQNNANKYLLNGRAPIPGAVVSRNDSMKNKFDHEQQQMYREGLATDKKILERSPSLKRPPGVPRQAFTEQDPDDIRVSIDNEENENRLQRQENGINIGSDDEFFLVGENREQQPERFFTHARRPGQTTVRPLPGSHDMFCPKHDMRHALPWSLINQYQIRESSLLDINSVSKQHTTSKSANNVKRDMDDRRLRELLEELYKDKKYFDHVIDTTEPNTEPIIDERDLAEHGRGFLLDRAEYWDGRGVHIPRPPTTALGLRLSRMNTNLPDSGRVSNISYASTVTPPPHPEQRQDEPKQPTQAFVKREHTVC